MDIYIDGRLVATLDGSGREAAREAEKYLAPGYGFGRAWMDGAAYAGVTSLPDVQDAPTGRLDLEMLTADELARQTADSLHEYLERVVPYVESLASSLRFGEVGVIQRLEALVPAFAYIDAAERGIKAAADVHTSERPKTAQRPTLTRRLEEVVLALERSDVVEAADILEYVVRPELDAIRGDVRARRRATNA